RWAAGCRWRRPGRVSCCGRTGRHRRPPTGSPTCLPGPPSSVFPARSGSLPRYGSGVLRLFDTAYGAVRELDLREPGKVSMYVCGPTVYDVPHIGHGRNVLVYDVLRRYLEWSGLSVRHVSNITDIDDNIIKRSHEEDRPADEVAKHYEAAWWDALAGLNVLRPTDVPHATDYVDDMVE